VGGTHRFDDDRGPAHRYSGPSPVPAPADALHEATLDFLATEDAGEIAGKLLGAASRIVPVDGSSIWVPVDDCVQCRGAIGERRSLLSGTTISASSIGGALDDEDDCAVAAVPLVVDGNVTAYVRVTRSLARHGGFNEAERDVLRRLTEAAGAAIAGAARLAASQKAAAESARDLALITEMSREITSTLDLDRVPALRRQSREQSVDLRPRRACPVRARRV
jgi:hypothetical protein